MKKTIFITGSTDGIGKLAAQRLASEGHEVFVHGRNPNKVKATVAEIQASASSTEVRGYVADLSDLRAVAALGQQLAKELPRLDVLINNAGVFKSPNATNAEGLELRMVVNYLAPYLLTQALHPQLQQGEQPRIINLSSAAQAPVSMAALQGNAIPGVQEAYAQSKLAITEWSFYLAKQWKDISVIAVNPGSLLNTRMVREGYGTFWSPAEKGSDLLYELAVGAEYSGITGKYYDNDQGGFGKAHRDAYDSRKIAELIQTTEGLLAALV
ncbi:MAG TPA: short-chain dehydrogenase [Cytophagales bacterium]|nr:short-chain dehydrogenase [Cytophagales bacterium]